MRLANRYAPHLPAPAEAHASLAAALWAEGKQAAAEGEFEAARQLELKWNDMRFVRASTRWPPKLYDALQSFLALS